MTNQKPKPWQLSLSALHVVMLLGLVTGSMAGAFYLGFSSGQHVGYESALQATQNTMARLPVPTEELDKGAAEEVTSEVYAKLTGTADLGDEPPPSKSAGHTTDKAEEIPDLGAIVTTDTAPILPSDPSEPGVGKAAVGDDLLPGSAGAAKAGSLRELPSKATEHSNHPSVVGEVETLGGTVHTATEEARQAVTSQHQVTPQLSQEHLLPQEPPAASVPRINGDTVATRDTLPSAAIEAVPPVSARQGRESKPESLKTEEPPAVVAGKGTTEKTQPPPAKQEGAVPVKRSIPVGWYVQVSAQKNLDEANKAASTLRRAGFPVLIEAAQVRGEDYYRVVSGPKTQRSAADQLLTQIKGRKLTQGDPFVRAVK